MGQRPTWDYEERARRHGARAVAGIDEAGRGPLAGPVVAAAVILAPGDAPDGVNDSKLLSPRRREALHDLIRARARAVGVGIVAPADIDRLNILVATRLAMMQAVAALEEGGCPADHLLIDALTLADVPLPQDGIVKGDRKSVSIAAASIVAKVTRDRMMLELDARHPGYGLAVHKGYPTAAHREALRRLGPSPAHRLSFAGVTPPAREAAG